MQLWVGGQAVQAWVEGGFLEVRWQAGHILLLDGEF